MRRSDICFKKVCVNCKYKKNEYSLYFGCKVCDQDKKWASHMCCTTCSSKVSAWVNYKGHSVTFVVPVIWREPTNLYGTPY